MSRATSAATSVLDAETMSTNAASALVRYLDVLHADVWRFDGRHVERVASSGSTAAAPAALAAPLARIARGGLAQSVGADELGAAAACAEWKQLMFSLGAHRIGVHALATGDQVLGAITVVLPDDADEQVFEAITIFAQQVAAALDKANLHQAARDAANAMQVQNRVLAELTDERDVPSLRVAVEQLVCELFGDAAVALLPIDSAARLTVPSLTPPSDGTLRVATEPELALVAPTVDVSDPVRLKQPSQALAAELGLSTLSPRRGSAGAALWGIKLQAGGRPIGVLLVGVASNGGASELPELMRTIAPAVSIALENAQLFAREHVRASRLAAANSLARTVTASTTREELYDAVVLGVRALFGFTRAAVYDSALQALVDEGHRAPRTIDRERTLVSTALHRRRSSRIERHDRTCIAIPLVSADGTQAVLYTEQPDTVTPEQESDDLALLESICEHAAACLVAIDATGRIERNYKDTIQALVHALEARDQYTADHSDEVSVWALETGRRLGMTDSELRDLELGAILHDIGKVAVPDDILHKPGRLTVEEFEVMKTHTVVGERILKPIGFLKNVAPIVRHEHERWDGRGYPDGISGEDIPLASRIIFVCDAYHAITSDRPYREAQSHSFARRIVTENAGTQFDPAVVGVFLEVIDTWALDNGIDLAGQHEGVEINNPLRPAKVVEESSDEDAAAA